MAEKFEGFKMINQVDKFRENMTESHITKLSLAYSCIQLRLISEIVIGEIVGNCKGLSMFILLEIAHQYFKGCFSVVELEDQFVGKSQKPKKNAMFEGE